MTKFYAIPDLYISLPLSLKPKLHGNWWQFHHLLYLQGSLINCHIPRNYGALEYTSIDNTIAILISLSRKTMMVNNNLSDAFCHILIAPGDW